MPFRFLTLVGIVLLVSGCGSQSEPRNDPQEQANSEIEKVVRKVISEILKVDPASIDMRRPISDPPLKADDLDLVEIVLELEDRLGIEISDTQLEQQNGAKFGKDPLRLTPAQLVSIAAGAPKSSTSKTKRK